MPSYNYKKDESLERIRSILVGINPNDAGNYLGQKSENESLSDIAQILEDTLGISGVIPGTLLANTQKFGAIYTWTGTVVYTGMTSAWTKLTGCFQNAGEYSSSGITLEPNNARILINDWGIYFVSWQLSYIGSPDVDYKVEPYCFVGMPQAVAQSRPYSSGTITSMGGSGFAEASGTAVDVALYLYSSVTAWMIPKALQLNVMKVGNLPK
jgi:hypothetical protein